MTRVNPIWNKDQLRVALVAPAHRHFGKVLAIRGSCRDTLEAYYRDFFSKPAEPIARVMVLVGCAVSVGDTVSLSDCHTIRTEHAGQRFG